ncbi:type VII secretion target [Gordonia soli]|nr:type VII secretion target [Gordonia soli]
MTQLTVHTPALTDHARSRRSVANTIADHAATLRVDVSALTPTYGVIGADFLAALAHVVDRRARALESAAGRQRTVGERTEQARNSYVATDDTALRL